jgi:hypothetical protein
MYLTITTVFQGHTRLPVIHNYGSGLIGNIPVLQSQTSEIRNLLLNQWEQVGMAYGSCTRKVRSSLCSKHSPYHVTSVASFYGRQ